MLSEEIKKQLGYIIKQNRNYKSQEFEGNTKDNPYSKINFCENICHYHTLTKLESNYISDDQIYYTFLNKLGLKYTVTLEEHKNNMKVLDNILHEILRAIEYIDDDLSKNIKNQIDMLFFGNDCIGSIHLNLFNFFINLQFIEKIEKKQFTEINKYKELYQGVYKGLFHHGLGIYFLNKLKGNESFKELSMAKEIYDSYNISKGIINTSFIFNYLYRDKYLEAVNLCNEMESYYKKTRNNKRLLHVYSTLLEYYSRIKAISVFESYYNKIINMLNNDRILKKYEYVVNYNYGLSLFKENCFEEALEYLMLAYSLVPLKQYKMKIITVLLFTLTKLKVNDEVILNYIETGVECYDEGVYIDQITFKYFKYKYENSSYYRKYALEKLIPMFKQNPHKLDFLLILYQDLFE